MFTGIVETTVSVLQKSDQDLLLMRPKIFNDIKVGSSIAVSGVCLSVVELQGASMRFQIVPETWRCTNLGALKEGERVNLERSLRADGRFEGHVVQGHVEGVGEILSITDTALGKEMSVRLPRDLLPCVVPKGCIALDGVSLTVARIADDVCTVALIPQTLAITTFGDRRVGQRVNGETDILLRGLKHLRDVVGMRVA